VTGTRSPAPDPAALRVLLVDDHELLAEPLAMALGFEGLVAQVAPLDSADAVVAAAVTHDADLVLLDLDLGGTIGNGSDLIPAMTGAGCRVLVVTGSTDAYAAARALELGAIGVVHKHQPFAQLVATVVAAAHGQTVMDLEQRRKMIQAARTERRRRSEVDEVFSRLSEREAQVLRALADGQTVSEIAATSVVAEATVRSQVRGVLTKLGVGHQLAAVAMARRAGWLGSRAS
jgi:DNA-binding NarL/FixJ family response regulator